MCRFCHAVVCGRQLETQINDLTQREDAQPQRWLQKIRVGNVEMNCGNQIRDHHDLNSSFRFVTFFRESSLQHRLEQVDCGPEKGARATTAGCKLQDTAHLSRSTTRVGCTCRASAATWATCNIFCVMRCLLFFLGGSRCAAVLLQPFQRMNIDCPDTSTPCSGQLNM